MKLAVIVSFYDAIKHYFMTVHAFDLVWFGWKCALRKNIKYLSRNALGGAKLFKASFNGP